MLASRSSWRHFGSGGAGIAGPETAGGAPAAAAAAPCSEPAEAVAVFCGEPGGGVSLGCAVRGGGGRSDERPSRGLAWRELEDEDGDVAGDIRGTM
jgi:hypothetical protein